MHPSQLLACAFDPARILQFQGFSPDPWQCELLLSAPAYTLLNCSRQVGKSTVVAALALHRALFFPNALVLLLSPSLRQSSEIFRKLVSQYEPFRAAVPCKRQTKSLLELHNGARVLSLPGKEQFLRSFGGVTLLILDEAARIPDALYHSVRPMLAVSGGNLIALSTPFGKRGWFHDAWIGKEPWRRIEIPWNLCPRISPAFIHSEIASMGQAWVNQEYCCSFHQGKGLVFADFELAIHDLPFSNRGKLVGGIDFGWNNPFAAIWGHLDQDDVLWIFGEVYERQTLVDDLAQRLPKGTTWYADPSGPAEMAALRRKGLNIRPGNNNLRTGIALVSSRIRTGKLRILRSGCPNLIRESALYRYEVEGSEKPVDRDNHALAALRYLVASLEPPAKPATPTAPANTTPLHFPNPWRRIT